MINNNSLIIIMIMISSLSATVHAKPDAPAASGGKKQKYVKVKFDDELVKGATAKPDGLSMNVRKEFNYKKLIRIRENFINEMENGLDDFNNK